LRVEKKVCGLSGESESTNFEVVSKEEKVFQLIERSCHFERKVSETVVSEIKAFQSVQSHYLRREVSQFVVAQVYFGELRKERDFSWKMFNVHCCQGELSGALTIPR
jgi:hypothetical protein